MEDKSILITGGSGFIGSEAVRTLINNGSNVFNLDKLTYASCQESLLNLPVEKYNFIHGDIANIDTVKKTIDLAKPDFIINFAAESHVDRSIEDPSLFIQTNILGTYNLLNGSYDYYLGLDKSQKNTFRFIHISTDEVFGSLDINEESFKENNNYLPNSPYSASKAASDMLVRSWFKTYNFPTITTHSSNNYGPWQDPEKLIPRTILNALNEEPIEIYGNGENIRDWLFVTDNVNAITKLLMDGKVGENYNIGGNNEISNINLVNLLCKILNQIKPRTNGTYEELITFVEDRPGHDLRYSLNISKINNDINWSPITGLEEGLSSTIKWYIDHFEQMLNKLKDRKRLGLINK